MFNLGDKKASYQIANTRELIIFDKEFVPFSSMFNLASGYVHTTVTLPEMMEAYKKTPHTIGNAKVIENSLRSWINQIPYHLSLMYETGSYRVSVSELLRRTTECLYFSEIYINRYAGYVRGYYTLMDQYFRHCYFILMVKKEYVSYVKMCALTGEPVLEDCFEYWYDPTLLESDLKAKRLNKLLLKQLKDFEVPCIEKTDILKSLIPRIEFQAPTISSQKEKIAEFASSFLELQNDIFNKRPQV
jgi:hypothetical protein